MLTLSGCATVSMVSRDAVVLNEQTVESSALAESAKAFNTRAEAQGWIGEPRGLMDFAKVLFGGDESGNDTTNGTYAERISASDGEPAVVYEAISSDTASARRAFTEVGNLAQTLLDEGEVSRSDLINFETALVTAQKCYRGFSEAVGLVAARDRSGLAETEAALTAFATEIDAARKTADKLADAYASTSEPVEDAAAS